MKILAVDDKPETFFHPFQTYVQKSPHRWVVEFCPPDADLVSACMDERPDVVLLDVALSEADEAAIDSAAETAGAIGLEDPSQVGGIRKCHELKSAIPECPVVLVTRFDETALARAAFAARADQFVIKSADYAAIARIIECVVRGNSRCDAELYDVIRRHVEGDTGAWERPIMLDALDAYYRNASPLQRFGLLCVHLSKPLARVFPNVGELTSKLVGLLVDSHTVLSLVDRGLRDHVRHSGNVLWLGYYLLHAVDEFRTPEVLGGYRAQAYSGATSLRDQLNYAWLIASLFHDCGYVDEKEDLVDRLLARVFPYRAPEKGRQPAVGMSSDLLKPVRTFVEQAMGQRSVVERLISWAVEHWQRSLDLRDGGKKTFQDHGVLGAARLLRCVQPDRVPEQWRPAFFQAVIAIMLHHVSEWQEYKEFDVEPRFPLGALPCCNLLTLCDTVQTWDREAELGQGGDDASQELKERLIHYRDAFVSRSEIVQCEIVPRTNGNPYELRVGVQFYLRYGDNAKPACAQHAMKVNDWITRQKARRVAEIFDLTSFIKTRIRYIIPTVDGIAQAEF